MSKYHWEELKKRGDEGGWRVRNWERGKGEEIQEGGGEGKWEGAGKER